MYLGFNLFLLATLLFAAGEKNVAETEPNTIQNAHLKLQKPVSVEVSAVHEQLFDVNEIQDGYTEQPSGAFVSLTVGK